MQGLQSLLYGRCGVQSELKLSAVLGRSDGPDLRSSCRVERHIHLSEWMIPESLENVAYCRLGRVS